MLYTEPMRLLRIIILVTVTLGLGAAVVYFALSKPSPANSNTTAGTNKSYPPPGEFPPYPITSLAADARNNTLRSGRFNTSGVIVDIPSCPPCPKGAVCMPCPPPSLVVADRTGAPDTETLRLELETDAAGFTIGRAYAFSVLIDAETQTIELIGVRVQ